MEEVDREGEPEGDRLRPADRDPLRRQLSQHDVEEGDEEERESEEIEGTSVTLPGKAKFTTGRTTPSKADSPTQPSPRLARVTPSWVAER